jgi:hypothetical protein
MKIILTGCNTSRSSLLTRKHYICMFHEYGRSFVSVYQSVNQKGYQKSVGNAVCSHLVHYISFKDNILLHGTLTFLTNCSSFNQPLSIRNDIRVTARFKGTPTGIQGFCQIFFPL